MRIISPSGEKTYKIDAELESSTIEVNRLLPGEIGLVSINLVNYDPVPHSANVSLEIYDTLGNKYNWYIENQTQTITLPGSSPPPWSNITLKWRVFVPDNAPTSPTYLAKIKVKYDSGEHEYSQDFKLYPTYVVIFNTQPDQVSDDETFKRGGTICNYGDYNITINVTDSYTGEVTLSAVDYPAGADTSVAGEVRWYNIPLATGQCWRFLITYGGSKTLSSETMKTTVVWVDPATGNIQAVARSKDITRIKDSGAIHVHLGDFTTYYPGSTVTGSIKLVQIARAVASKIHSLELFIPPGFDNPRGFTITPDPGYPYGSVYEGWYVRWSPVGSGSIAFAAGETKWLNWTMDVVDINLLGGGKSFVLDLRGMLLLLQVIKELCFTQTW
jgi:hypothetical protein